MNLEEVGITQVSPRAYFFTYLISLLLTLCAFTLTTYSLYFNYTIVLIILISFTQIILHVIYFLHLRSMKKELIRFIALIYTVILLLVLGGASIWVLHNLNQHVMPT